MSRTPPPFDKDGMDSFSERTYNNENTPYNIELNRLRSHLPDSQPARPRSMEYGYNPRYDKINNAPAEKSSKGMKRLERVFATMCCGSCLCFLLWIIVSSLLVTAFTVLLVKVLHHPTTASSVVSATSIPAMEPSTMTVTQSTESVPISTTTAFSTTTESTVVVSFSTLTTVSGSTETYTPSIMTLTVTSEMDGTTMTSLVTTTDTDTTTQAPTPTSIVTQTTVSVTSVDVTATSEVTTTATTATTATSTMMTTTTRNHNDNDNDDNDENDLDASESRTRSSTARITVTSVRTIASQVSASVLSGGRDPVVGPTYQSTSTSVPTIKVPISMILSVVSSAVENTQTSPLPKSSSRSVSAVKPLPLIGNLAPSLTQRRRDYAWSESKLNIGTGAIEPPTRQASAVTDLGSAAAPTFSSGLQGPAKTSIWIPPDTQHPVADNNTSEVVANNLTDDSSETGTGVRTRIDASTPSADEFPATENLGAISAKITSYEGYISIYSSTNAGIDKARADALSSMRSEYSSVTSWCSEHNTEGAALSIKSYCGPNASANTRRDTVPTTGMSNLGVTETTLITKYISITNIVTLTSTTSLNTTDTTNSAQSTHASEPPSSASASPKTLNRRKDILAAWGVTNLHHPAEIGTNILRLPPHHWDCVRRPRACVTLLSLLGALCGIPFGMILFVILRACWKCCMKRRAEKKFEEERKQKPGFDAAIERMRLNKLGAKLGGEWSWAGNGTKKKGRRGSGGTIEMGEDKKY